MDIKISKEIIKKYPQLEVGVVIAREIDNANYNEEIQSMIKDLIQKKREEANPEKITEIPTIAKWREIYTSFGAKPRDFRNSIEALLRRILKKDLYKINPLVDIYNYISIKHTMTAGGEDIDAMEGDVVLDFANGNEEFIPLGEEENKSPWEGEVVYKDNKGIICRCWNWREGDRTKLTEDTKNAVIVLENVIPEKSNELKEALDELKELIERYCNAQCEIQTLHKENPSHQIKQ